MFSLWLLLYIHSNLQNSKLLYKNIQTVHQFKLLLSKPLPLTPRIQLNLNTRITYAIISFSWPFLYPLISNIWNPFNYQNVKTVQQSKQLLSKPLCDNVLFVTLLIYILISKIQNFYIRIFKQSINSSYFFQNPYR